MNSTENPKTNNVNENQLKTDKTKISKTIIKLYRVPPVSVSYLTVHQQVENSTVQKAEGYTYIYTNTLSLVAGQRTVCVGLETRKDTFHTNTYLAIFDIN